MSADNDPKTEWLKVAIAPEDRPETLTPRQVAEADQALVAAGGDASLLTLAGGEQAIAEWYATL